VRVPLFIYDSDQPGGTVDRLVSKLDLTPTIYDWTVAKPLLPPDGKSLVPLYTEAASSWPTDTYISHLRIQDGIWDVRPWHAIRQDCAVVRPCYKLVRYPASTAPLADGTTISLGEEFELYDLSHDPWELTNLLPDTVTGYRGQPGWSMSNPIVVDLMKRLAAHEASGK
jgi:arylsulfatase A-like enzyme